MIYYIVCFHIIYILFWVLNSVIKPGPARRVDPGPGGWTGSGLIKDRLGQQLGQTRATRANPDETRFFFNVGFETHYSIYTLCSQEKSHVFSMWNKKPFGLNTST